MDVPLLVHGLWGYTYIVEQAAEAVGGALMDAPPPKKKEKQTV